MEPTPEQVMRDLSHDLMSPYCPGRTIASCPSEAARKLEDRILVEAESGKTREQIESQLVQRFGPEVVGYAGRPIILWGSLAVGLVAAVGLARMARRWVAGSAMSPVRVGDSAPAGTGSTPRVAELDAVEDALDELDEF
jgi:cytochrome c-type biogenesis protein CcmH/NrfF